MAAAARKSSIVEDFRGSFGARKAPGCDIFSSSAARPQAAREPAAAWRRSRPDGIENIAFQGGSHVHPYGLCRRHRGGVRGRRSATSAQVITHRDVGVRMGLAIAVAALDQCEADGNSVSVAVVDRAGRLRVFLQSDKANPHNIELARRKAYTARTFGRTSADWAKRTAELPELAAQRQLEDVIALRGGVPIKIGNETIGAVGVSGSSSEGDEKCAIAGIAKVADQLK